MLRSIMNINALVMWVLAALIGYFLTGTFHGALIGFAWALAASFAVSLHGIMLVIWAIAFVVWLFV